jgi:predicted phage gp36 major capsid-like protein
MTAFQAPETKSAEVAAAYDELARAFSAFKDTNETRLAEIETRLSPDPLAEEKLARIGDALDQAQRRIDRIALDARRPALAAAEPRDPAVAEHKAAFQTYVRTGEAAGLKRLEAKALSAGSGPDGGYLVPDTVEREVLRRLAAISPIRAVASVHHLRRALQAGLLDGRSHDRLGRRDRRAAADRRLHARRALLPGDGTLRSARRDADAARRAIVDIDQWIADEFESAFAEQEGAAFVAGDGVNKPKGFLASVTVDNAAWEWGKLGFVATGQAGGFPAASPTDKLIDLIYALRAGYRQNAVFVMNRKTQGAIRKFKDADGNYLWQPPAGAGQAATLMSFPVVEAEDMPDIAANSLSIAFGDFKRGYLVVDRAGVRVLRDPYSAKPYVLFYTTKRVGGGVQDYDAIKLLKFA